MTRYFLRSTAIEGFRGINNDDDPLVLKFKPEAVNSVHAPNGVGKSSIFEALHFALHGTVPRLTELQDAEDGASYIINKFHPDQQATIALVFASDDHTPDIEITVTRNAAGRRVVSSPSGHTDPEKFLTELREDFVLVDYARFTKFIDASALERGRSFASLVGLSRYSRLRQALDGVKNARNMNSDLGIAQLEADVEATKLSLSAIERRILDAHNGLTGISLASLTDTKPLKVAVTNAIGGIGLLKPMVANRSIMDLDFDAAEKVIEKEEGGEARQTIDALNAAISTLSQLTVEDAEIADSDRLIRLSQQRDEAIRKVGAVSLHALLQDALTVVTGDEWHNPHLCPVCENLDTHPLKDKLEAKVAIYDEATRLNAELVQNVEAAISMARLRLLEEATAMGIAGEDRLHTLIVFASRQGSVETGSFERLKARLVSLEEKRNAIVTAAQTEMTSLQAKLPPSLVQVSRTLSLAKQFREAVQEYETKTPLLQAKQRKVERLNRWKRFISNVSQSFGEAETALSNDRIDEIKITCQDLFGHLVRGGPDVKPTLMRSQNSEQVDLKLADFFGLPDLSARALLSESYRNAVATAIFLAAATKHNGIPRFMVLDDVTSSFDAGHQFSLMDAVRTRLRYGTVANGLQFIILSHDTSIEKYFDRHNNTTDWHHQKLQGMPPKGRLMVSSQESDRLKAQALHHLNAGMVDIGAPFVRQYLEYKLGQIISRLEIPVPPDYATRGDRRTLSTYMDAITDAVDLFQAANRCVLEAQQISDLKNYHAPSIMGNYVSHYETGVGNPFNAYALIGVIQNIDGMADCFCYTDPSNGQKRFYRKLDRRN